MSIVTATITEGAYNLSERVSVTAAVANGTTVVICRGEFLIGSGTTTSGLVLIQVPPLAIGDIIQASITERGNGAGIPVRVGPNPIAATGWLKPETLLVEGDLLTVAEYEETYGETPGAIYDPVAAGQTQLPADYDRVPPVELGFDVETMQQAGTTTVRIVPRNGEGLLVGWNGATPTSPAALTLTSSATITVAVQRDDRPTTTLSRSLSVVVLPAPTAPSTPAAGDVIAASYRLFGGGFVRALINSKKNCEALLVGHTTTWQPGVTHGPQFQEVDWVPVPDGNYTCLIRVIGETNPANYFTFIIAFQP